MKPKISLQKESGATFTPPDLAKYLALEIFKVFPSSPKEKIKVLDPACGDGELLLAVSKALENNNQTSVHLTGFDLNQDYVRQSESRLKNSGVNFFEIQQADFLMSGSSLQADIVIANPPYVRTQILGEEKAKFLANKYRLKGRVDLYYPFLIEMTHSLKTGGILGVITSNRYLFTKSGESVREFLNNYYDVIKIIDLGDTKIFESAAVLPAIFIGRKKTILNKPTNEASFLKIYEDSKINGEIVETVGSLYDLLNSGKSGVFKLNNKHFRQTKGKLIYHTNNNSWQLLSEEEQEWTRQIDQISRYKIKDLAKVRVGVKTTADNVFIRDNWEEMETNLQPESELLRPLISNNNIQKWQAPYDSNYRILYTHALNNGKKTVIDLAKYPKASNYLNTHKDQLTGRSYVIASKRNWFEIWVPQQPSLWPKAKLVFPDISEGPKFFLDTNGAIVDGNCYWISIQDTGSLDLLLLIQGLANSKVMALYHDLCFNNRLYSGRRRYLTQYVENYPIPDPENLVSKEIITTVKKLNALSRDGKPTKILEEHLNNLVFKVFNLKHSPPAD